jgi:hypothetical protein
LEKCLKFKWEGKMHSSGGNKNASMISDRVLSELDETIIEKIDPNLSELRPPVSMINRDVLEDNLNLTIGEEKLGKLVEGLGVDLADMPELNLKNNQSLQDNLLGVGGKELGELELEKSESYQTGGSGQMDAKEFERIKHMKHVYMKKLKDQLKWQLRKEFAVNKEEQQEERKKKKKRNRKKKKIRKTKNNPKGKIRKNKK